MSTICIFSALFLPNMGGVERFTDSLAAELAAEGHSVIVVTNNTHGLSNREILDSGVEVIRFPCKNLIGGRYPVPIKNGCYRELMADLEARRVDGVLVNTRFYLHSLIGVRFAESKGLRAVVLDHGSAYLTLGSRPLDWVIERYEDGITALLKRHDIDFYGISKKSVEWLSNFGIEAKGVINNAINAEAYWEQASGRQFRKELGICEPALFVVFVGRLVAEKGVRLLLEAMKDLCGASIHLVVAGEGPLSTEIEECGLPNVHYLGRLDTPDVASLLMNADVLCLPTRSEGFATTLLEASACGIPCIVPDVGGAKELISDGQNGYILEQVTAWDLSNMLLIISGDKDKLLKMGELSMGLVRDSFCWSRTAQLVLCALE